VVFFSSGVPTKTPYVSLPIHAICLTHHTVILCRKIVDFLVSELAVGLGLLSARLQRVRGLISTKSFKWGGGGGITHIDTV
jgi:hypothetical protein